VPNTTHTNTDSNAPRLPLTLQQNHTTLTTARRLSSHHGQHQWHPAQHRITRAPTVRTRLPLTPNSLKSHNLQRAYCHHINYRRASGTQLNTAIHEHRQHARGCREPLQQPEITQPLQPRAGCHHTPRPAPGHPAQHTRAPTVTRHAAAVNQQPEIKLLTTARRLSSHTTTSTQCGTQPDRTIMSNTD
jgi:hypothetical protein